MPRITDLLVQRLDAISSNYFSNVAEPAHKILNMREDLLSGDSPLIRSFNPLSSLGGVSLSCVDGGSLLQQLSGGDLLVTAATLGEGYTSEQVYFDDDLVPSEVFSEVLPHRQSNNELLSAVRAMLEMKVLRSSETNWRIIDGAYLGNVSTFLFSLIKDGGDVREGVLSSADYDFDGLVNEAIVEILTVDGSVDNKIVAVPKSDSSTVFTQHVFKDDVGFGFKMTDRVLSGVVLHPGEYFHPRVLKSNNMLIERLSRLNESSDFITKSNSSAALWRLLEGKAELLKDLDVSPEDNSKGKLYATYFKPSRFSTSAPSLKVEFNHVEGYGSLTERVEEVVALVDADIVDESIMEPWSQYFADVRAKEVSVGADMIKNHLMSTVTTSYELSGLTRNYRT